MAPTATIIPPTAVREMFDRIAPEYDRFNALASFGMHRAWRQALVRRIPLGARVLDIATGTGDVAFMARSQGHDVVGLDFSEAMVARAREKDAAGRIQWVTASAEALPFGAGEYGAVTSAFALRNFRARLDAVLAETHRVLKTGGVTLHLDFGRPSFPPVRWGHRLHLLVGVPVMGRMLCGERWPSHYLENTIEDFLDPQEMSERLERAGFVNVSHRPILGGVVRLYRGVKAC
jgi:demethylmenaquinone methyltransferase/2-methoxy-6-polyprenyl-1,4-benzoquinol methylase